MKKKLPPQRHLVTRSGQIQFPAYIPVTTFGNKYPLDDLVRPFLPRLASALMVSQYYARQATQRPGLPLMVDSGGYASLFEWASVEECDGLGVIQLKGIDRDDVISPDSVLSFQEEAADVAFSLDFPIPPARADEEGERRLRLTIANALWALRNRRRRDLPLYACVQGWDLASYTRCAEAYVGQGFDGIALGGLVPRMHDRTLLENIVKAVRTCFPDAPLHAFGLGQPGLVKRLFDLGVDSVDSSAYVKLAAQGRTWDGVVTAAAAEMSPLRRMHLALANLATGGGRALPLGFAQIQFAHLRDPTSTT